VSGKLLADMAAIYDCIVLSLALVGMDYITANLKKKHLKAGDLRHLYLIYTSHVQRFDL